MEPCENWRQFYWLWIKVALTASFSWADGIGFAVGILIPLLHKLLPSMKESTLTPLAWEIPLAIFCAVGAVRIIIAPYLIYRDRHLLAKRQELSLSQDIASQSNALKERDEKIRAISEKPQRTPAEQHDYETVLKALTVVRKKGIDALRHLRRQGQITFDHSSCTAPLAGYTNADLLYVYRHCAVEGVLHKNTTFGNSEETFTIPANMEKPLAEALFTEGENSK